VSAAVLVTSSAQQPSVGVRSTPSRIDVFADGKRSTGTLDPARSRSAAVRWPPPRASWAVGPAEVMGDIPSPPSRTPERGLSRMDELRAIVAICERVVDPASEESR
jgi:hypothetical protein